MGWRAVAVRMAAPKRSKESLVITIKKSRVGNSGRTFGAMTACCIVAAQAHAPAEPSVDSLARDVQRP